MLFVAEFPVATTQHYVGRGSPRHAPAAIKTQALRRATAVPGAAADSRVHGASATQRAVMGQQVPVGSPGGLRPGAGSSGSGAFRGTRGVGAQRGPQSYDGLLGLPIVECFQAVCSEERCTECAEDREYSKPGRLFHTEATLQLFPSDFHECVEEAVDKAWLCGTLHSFSTPHDTRLLSSFRGYWHRRYIEVQAWISPNSEVRSWPEADQFGTFKIGVLAAIGAGSTSCRPNQSSEDPFRSESKRRSRRRQVLPKCRRLVGYMSAKRRRISSQCRPHFDSFLQGQVS